MAEREDITDVIEEMRKNYKVKTWKEMGIVVGRVLKFSMEGSITTLKIVEITKDGKYFAERIYTTDMDTGMSHYGHIVETDAATQAKYQAGYCVDCQVPTNEPATENGEEKAYLRQQEAEQKAKAEEAKREDELKKL